MSALEMLPVYLSYPFVQAALAVGVLVALCCSLFGVTLVLDHRSFLGDSLSHVAFGAMAVSGVLHLTNNLVLTLLLTVACSVLLMRGAGLGSQGDSSLAMLSVGALALGYLLMNLFSNSANVAGDVCGVLFGSTSILTLTGSDVAISAVLAVVVIAFFVIFYHQIFLISFDEENARAAGIPVDAIKTALAAIMAIVIVISMNLVGALLISALLVFPVRSAMHLCNSYKAVVAVSCAISAACALAGMLVAIAFGTPVGSTIIAIDACVYLAIAIPFRVRKAQ